MLSIICLVINFGKLSGADMDYKILLLDHDIEVTGLKTAIVNGGPDAQSVQIGMAWNKYFALNIKNNAKIYSVYTDYDQNMNYSLVIATDGEFPANIPSINFVIPAGKYAVFTVKGSMPEAIQKFWADLWANISTFTFVRSFKVDFELYDENFFKAEPEVDVYIAIE